MCRAEKWTFRKVDQKCLGSFEIWCWRRMEKIIWTSRVRNEKLLHTAKKERNVLYTIKRNKANWIDHILVRNSVLKYIIERKLEGGISDGRQGRRRQQLLGDLKKMIQYCKLKEQALDRIVRRTHFERGKGPVVRQTMEQMMNEL